MDERGAPVIIVIVIGAFSNNCLLPLFPLWVWSGLSVRL